MKRLLLLATLWILGLCFLLNAAWAQTVATTLDKMPMSGGLLVGTETPATNTPVVVVPVVQRVESWLTVAKDWASGALVIITALLGWLANLNKNKATESGTIASVLIQEIQKLGSKQVKDSVASAARDAGVGDALHAKVKEETPSAPEAVKELMTAAGDPLPTPPVVPIANPHDTKP